MITKEERKLELKKHLDNHEEALTRLLNKLMKKEYGTNWLTYQDEHGNFLVSQKDLKIATQRFEEDPERFGILVNALVFELKIKFIRLFWHAIFGKVFDEYITEQHFEKEMDSIIAIRNKIGHQNPFSLEEYYCGIHLSLKGRRLIKQYYNDNNDSLFKTSRVVKIESDGQVFYHDLPHTRYQTERYLMPGDTVIVNVDVSAARPEYELKWNAGGRHNFRSTESTEYVIEIDNDDITEHFQIECQLTDMNADYHRVGQHDDFFRITYKAVIPPQ